jgi:hypothetical protein
MHVACQSYKLVRTGDDKHTERYALTLLKENLGFDVIAKVSAAAGLFGFNIQQAREGICPPPCLAVDLTRRCGRLSGSPRCGRTCFTRKVSRLWRSFWQQGKGRGESVQQIH